MEDEQNVTGDPTGGKKEYEVGNCKPPVQHQFTKEKQPPTENKKRGKDKKKFERESILELLSMPHKLKEASTARQQLVEAYGPKVLKLSGGQLWVLRAIQKGILTGSGKELPQFLNQALGMPKQKLEHSGPDGEPIPINQTTVVTKTLMIKPPTQNPHDA